MICPICKTRWAPMIEDLYAGGTEDNGVKLEEERAKAFESNEIRSCGSPDCLETADAHIAMDDFNFMDRWTAEVKEMIKKGKI